MPMKQKMNKTNITIRLTDEARQILEERSSRLGLNRSAFVELAIRAKAKRVDQDYAMLEQITK